MWSTCNLVGDTLVPGGGNTIATKDYKSLKFFLIFPPKQLHIAMAINVLVTSPQHRNRQLPERTSNTMGSRSSQLNLSPKMRSCFIVEYSGMVEVSKRPWVWVDRNVKVQIWTPLLNSLSCSHQLDAPGEGESKDFRKKLVDDFVKNFNNHWAIYFNPSDYLTTTLGESNY